MAGLSEGVERAMRRVICEGGDYYRASPSSPPQVLSVLGRVGGAGDLVPGRTPMQGLGIDRGRA